MFSKRARRYDPKSLPRGKRLRQNICDLFMSNQISGKRAAEILQDMAAAGVKGVSELTRAANTGKEARGLLRALTRNSQWPCLFCCSESP